jgi:uncharacterized protein YndB with AHSA1/START domain
VIGFEATVEVARPRDEVFAYVADPRSFPEWNSAVASVEALSRPAPAVGARYLMRRRLPTGPASNELAIVAWAPPDTFVVRTTSGPTPFTYNYRFADTARGTAVRLLAEIELPGTGPLIGRFAARAVKRGVDDNLATLRGILESGSWRSGR